MGWVSIQNYFYQKKYELNPIKIKFWPNAPLKSRPMLSVYAVTHVDTNPGYYASIHASTHASTHAATLAAVPGFDALEPGLDPNSLTMS